MDKTTIAEFKEKLTKETNEELFYELVKLPVPEMSIHEDKERDCILSELTRRLNVIW